jgi:uncharacterized protein (DUF2267 family)
MTWPSEYQRAAQDFERFMVAARDAAGLQTTNMAWTMVESVFRAFRSRLTVPDALAFAAVLPPLVRALFLEDWHPTEPEAFPSRQQLTREVQPLRALHNFAPDNAIQAVAVALRSAVDACAFETMLETLPSAAREFWTVPH